MPENETSLEAQTEETDPIQLLKNPLTRALLLALGHLSVALGVIGIALPLLPTTPFLLLAAWCYSKSSEKFHTWLLTNRWFGEYIRNYKEGKGIPQKTKILALSFLWTTILLSAFLVLDSWPLRGLLLFIASAVSWHILRLPTMKSEVEKA